MTGLVKRVRIDDQGRVISEKVVGQCDGEKLLDDAARILAGGFAQWLERRFEDADDR